MSSKESNPYINIISPEDLVSHPEMINHPVHYGGKDNPYEAIKVIEAWDLNFNLGNCLKYICRLDKKPDEGLTKDEKTLEDLNKALWYLQREIERVKRVIIQKESTGKTKE